MYAQDLAQALAEIAEIVEAYAAAYMATLQEFRAAIAEACKGPRWDGATIATDCDELTARVRREIEPNGTRRAYDCAGAVREIENEIETKEWGKIQNRRAKSKEVKHG